MNLVSSFPPQSQSMQVMQPMQPMQSMQPGFPMQGAPNDQFNIQQVRSQISHLIQLCSDIKIPTQHLDQLSDILLNNADRDTVRIFYRFILNLGTDQTKRLWLCELMEKLCLRYCECM